MHSEDVDIKIALSSTYWDVPPKARVWVGSNKIFEDQITDSVTISWSGKLDAGPQSIKIELFDKVYRRDTIVQGEKILKDQLLNIDDVLLDDISLGNMLWSMSEYKTEHNETHSRCVNLGWNGTWVLEFSVPIYVWLLDNL